MQVYNLKHGMEGTPNTTNVESQFHLLNLVFERPLAFTVFLHPGDDYTHVAIAPVSDESGQWELRIRMTPEQAEFLSKLLMDPPPAQPEELCDRLGDR